MNQLSFSLPFQKEIDVISKAIHHFSNIVIQGVKDGKNSLYTIKRDGSKVTMFDYAGQAIISHAIFTSFPSDSICAEENFSNLDENQQKEVKNILNEELDFMQEYSNVSQNIVNMRCWAIDPIDGTNGFIKGEHYAISVSLLIDKKTVLSLVGWPNHSSTLTSIHFDGPVIFLAVKNYGIYAISNNFEIMKIEKPDNSFSRILITGSGYKPLVDKIQQSLMIKENLQIDLMVKGIMIGCGTATLFLRVQLIEFAWDISPFELFVTESGGFATTSRGNPIVFQSDGYLQMEKEFLIFTSKDFKFHQAVIDGITQYFRSHD